MIAMGPKILKKMCFQVLWQDRLYKLTQCKEKRLIWPKKGVLAKIKVPISFFAWTCQS